MKGRIAVNLRPTCGQVAPHCGQLAPHVRTGSAALRSTCAPPADRKRRIAVNLRRTCGQVAPQCGQLAPHVRTGSAALRSTRAAGADRERRIAVNLRRIAVNSRRTCGQVAPHCGQLAPQARACDVFSGSSDGAVLVAPRILLPLSVVRPLSPSARTRGQKAIDGKGKPSRWKRTRRKQGCKRGRNAGRDLDPDWATTYA